MPGDVYPGAENELKALEVDGAVAWVDDSPASYVGLTRKELAALCEARDIEVPNRAKVAELVDLLVSYDAPDETVEEDADETDEVDETTEEGSDEADESGE